MLGSSPEIAGLISGTRIYLSARKDLPAGANLCAIFMISLSDHQTTSADSDVSLPSDLVLQKFLPPTCTQPPETPALFSFFSFSIFMIFLCASSTNSHSFPHLSLFLSDNQFITSRSTLSRAQNIQYQQHSVHLMYFLRFDNLGTPLACCFCRPRLER